MTDDPDDRLDQRSSMWSSELDDDEDSMDGEDDVDDKTDTHAMDDMSDTDDVGGESPKDTMDATHNQRDQRTVREQSDEGATEWDVDSIRESWQANSVRLPESVQTPFDKQHKHVDLDLEDVDTDVNYTKDRYYKPLVIALGLRELQDLDGDEVADLLEELERGGLLNE